LRGHLRQLLTGGGKDAFGRRVRVVFDGGEDRQPLFGHPAAVGAQGGCPCILAGLVNCHSPIQALIMTKSQ
jgi:hypothetical protein